MTRRIQLKLLIAYTMAIHVDDVNKSITLNRMLYSRRSADNEGIILNGTEYTRFSAFTRKTN